jgi:hypothetical protein
MPTIPNAPSGEDTSVDESEKFPVSGSKWMDIARLVEHIRTKAQTLTNKTLTTPTIASFANAQHNHSNAAGGGAVGNFPAGFIFGLTLSNNGSDATNDIDIATGKCRDSTDAVDIALASALTKQLDAAWAVGTNAGGLDTGAIANTTYFVWLIKRSDTGVVDVLFSASASSPTMPTNYDYKRRIGAIIRSGGAILAFSQNGDEFLLLTNVNSVASEATSTTAALKTMTVPIGIKVNAIISLRVDYVSASTAVLITSPDQTDVAAATANQTVTVTSGSTPNSVVLSQRTNTSGQIRIRSSSTGATQIITTYGWIDTRDRLAS